MTPKRDANKTYKVHGDGIDSLRRGFDHIGMPSHRHAEAMRIVSEVIAANNATHFYWYAPPMTGEVCGYWDDAEVNQLWVQPSVVYVRRVTTTRLPERALTHQKQDAEYVGWELPGATSGGGGGDRRAEVAEVLCPAQFIRVPAGVECSYCEVVHP